MPEIPLNYQSIPVQLVKASRYQARKTFDEAGIKALAESIRQEGLMEPIIVREIKDGGLAYELISGERRLKATQLLGLEFIEAKIIQTVSDAEAAAKGLIENLQREDLNPIEEAGGFKSLLDLHDSHWTQTQVADVVGRDKVYVSRSLSLLDLPEIVLEMLRQRNLTREHGIELLRLNNANSIKSMANKALKGDWSVKKTREAIDKVLNPSPHPEPPPSPIGPTDPLADVWLNIETHQPIAKAADWTVKYGPEETWTFVAKPHGGSYAEFLSLWFSQMAQSLSPLQTPKFTKTDFDAGAFKLNVSWNLVPQAQAYEIHYSFKFPDEPLKPMTTELPILGPDFTITFENRNHSEVWLAIKAVAAAGRNSPLSEPVHVTLA